MKKKLIIMCQLFLASKLQSRRESGITAPVKLWCHRVWDPFEPTIKEGQEAPAPLACPQEIPADLLFCDEQLRCVRFKS